MLPWPSAAGERLSDRRLVAVSVTTRSRMGRAPAPVVPRSRRQALSAASAASMSRSSCSGARISISPNTAACPHPDRAAMVGTDAETSNSAVRGTLRPRTSAQSGHVKRIRGCSGSCDEATPPRSERGRENGDDRVRRASASHNRAACRHTRSAMSRSVLLRWHVRPLWRSTVRPVAWIVTIIDLRHSEAISSLPARESDTTALMASGPQ